MRALLAALAATVVAGALTGPPAGAGPAPEPTPEAVVAALPFQRWDEPNRVVVDLAREGDRPLVMMLDTGAPVSIVTPLMARKLGVTVRRTKQTPYRRATRLGRDLQFYVDTQSSDSGSRTGWEYGLVGGDFLDDYVVEIDFPGRTVRFLDPKKYRVPEQVDGEDERVLPFKLAGTRVVVPVELGGGQVEVTLDTGAPDNLILSGAAARKVGIDVDVLPKLGQAGTALGPMEVRLHEETGFRFAGLAFDPLPVLVAPRGWYNLGTGSDSVIGYDLLRHFTMRIDYPRRRLWLRRTGERRITFLGADYAAAKEIGAYLTPTGGAFHVWGVVPGGAAAAYGLREGDAIVPAAGDAAPTLDDVLARIRTRGELTVARREGDATIDRVLPEEATPAP
jgi:predicted aspartyl protease